MTEKPNWAYKYPKKWEQIEFNKNFLRKVEEDCGGLHCEYCGKDNLVIYEWYEKTNNEDVATVDHFYPSSRYPELKKDMKNFVVACYKCNSNKKDDLWEVETIKHPRNGDIKNLLLEIVDGEVH